MIWFIVVFVPGTLINCGIYHRNQNEEIRSMMVSEVNEVARIGRATIAPWTEPYDSALQSENQRPRWPAGEAGQAAVVAAQLQVAGQRGRPVAGLVQSVLVACVTKKMVKEMTVRTSPNHYIYIYIHTHI